MTSYRLEFQRQILVKFTWKYYINAYHNYSIQAIFKKQICPGTQHSNQSVIEYLYPFNHYTTTEEPAFCFLSGLIGFDRFLVEHK